jgi:hypothetical protein
MTINTAKGKERERVCVCVYMYLHCDEPVVHHDFFGEKVGSDGGLVL